MMSDTELIAAARRCVGEFPLSTQWLTAGAVGAALVTEAGNVYSGICLDMACGVGFCAEHATIAAMLLQRETVIARIVAVDADRILAPCGRCRELMLQVDRRNLQTVVLLPEGQTRTLQELLPNAWLG